MPEITGFQLNQEIRRLAAENPGFVYTPPGGNSSCVYVQNGYGSCIVGRALVNLGVDPEWFTERVTDSSGFFSRPRNSETIHKLAEFIPGLVASKQEIEWAYYVQYRQDNDMPWGEAVTKADAEVSV